MRPTIGLAVLAASVFLVAAIPAPSGDDRRPQDVTVTNFPETQQVSGAVTVTRPIPSTRLLSNEGLVTTALPTDLRSLIDGGTLDASGFASGTLSLSARLQGSIGGPGKVGVLLVPDQPEILTAMRDHDVVQFPIRVETQVVPSTAGIHASTPLVVRFAFPQYRIFFYNTTPRTSSVTLYTYLSSS